MRRSRIALQSYCPKINVTEGAQNETLKNWTQDHCPLNDVTEGASLKAMNSHGGEVVRDLDRWTYLRVMAERYHGASRTEKRLILNEVTKNLGFHRKHAIRALNSIKRSKEPERRGRRRVYNDIVITHLRRLWLQMGQLCSRRMKAALSRWLENYEAPEVTKLLLLGMSRSTMDFYLRPYRTQMRRSSNSGTKSGRYIKTMIPIKPLDYNVNSPGSVEADTVHHCGGSLSGVYVITLTVTDVHTGWTECRAMWGKSIKGVTECMGEIEEALPFKISTICTDNGNEFLNHQFINYLRNRDREVVLKRGRPYRKNDQCHVEQKNFTHVRELLGWERIEVKDAIALINDIYRNEWSLLQNLFYPQMKLLSKLRVGAKYKKKYSHPQTPMERTLASSAISPETKARLEGLEKTLNPFELKKSIERKLKLLNLLLNQSETNQQKRVPA